MLPVRRLRPLDIGSPPHLSGGETFAQITRTTLAVASLAGLAGVALFGLTAALWLAIGMSTALLAEWLYAQMSGGRVTASFDHAVLVGLLVGLTLPVGRYEVGGFEPLGWAVPAVASLVAILVGKGVMGGMGNYLWHPALVGRAVAELLYGEQMHPSRWLVLARTCLFAKVPRPIEPVEYLGWRLSTPPDGANAWALPRPVDWLRRLADGEISANHEDPMTFLFRDVLPPWEDTLLGGVGGGIGETCAIALIVGGLYLIYRGYVRWQQPLSVLAGAAAAAAILPIRVGPGGDLVWLPGTHVDHALPVGVLYVLFHLTGGELMLCAFFFATDMVASPRTVRGQVVFGFGIGLLTIVLRLYGAMPGAGYWAVLLMNTLVPSIDRRTQRRVMGTGIRPI